MPVGGKRRRPLTRDEREDAARLNELWKTFQRANDFATQEWLARQCGWKTQGAAHQYLNGLIPLNLDAASRIANAIGISIEEFSPRLSQKLPRAVRESGAPYVVNHNDYQIPQLALRGSMGSGIPVPQDHIEIVRKITVSLADLRREVSITAPQNLSFLTGIGDSMEDTFSDGDVLLVDEGITDIKSDAVYVLEKGDELFIKTMQRMPDGSFLMISDNKKYAPFPITPRDLQTFKVRGRVLLAWNRRKL